MDSEAGAGTAVTPAGAEAGAVAAAGAAGAAAVSLGAAVGGAAGAAAVAAGATGDGPVWAVVTPPARCCAVSAGQAASAVVAPVVAFARVAGAGGLADCPSSCAGVGLSASLAATPSAPLPPPPAASASTAPRFPFCNSPPLPCSPVLSPASLASPPSPPPALLVSDRSDVTSPSPCPLLALLLSLTPV